MKRYAVIDVETTNIQDGKIPKTKFWGYADSEGYKRFSDAPKLEKFLRSIPETTLLHHSNFDIIQLLVENRELQIVKSHNTKIIECRFGKHNTINTLSCFPVPLKANENHAAGIFEAFGRKGTSLDNLAKRNWQDCVWGLECFLALDQIFFELCGVHPLEKGTIAGTGFSAAERIAGKMPKNLDYLEAYRGGRVEVFDLRYYGKNNSLFRQFLKRYIDENESLFPHNRILEDVHKFDICSSYPFSFIDAPKKARLLHIGAIVKDWHCPFFDEHEMDLLLFPNGKFTSWVYEDVYERFIRPVAEKTTIKKIFSKHWIDLSWLKELEGFVNDIYEKKNSSTGAIKLACKLLINATYGRIGLRGDGERARFLETLPDSDGMVAHKIGKRWLVFDNVVREPRSNFPMAAYITDNARGRLYYATKKNSGLYCDTDSIVIRRNEKNFIGESGSNLGEWKYEGQEPFRARNVKDYVWGEKTILKGGKEYMNWTLKRFAKGQAASAVTRSRKTELRKRIVNLDGTTNPLVVE